MLIIWRGLGCLTPIIIFGALLVTQLVVNKLFGEGSYEREYKMYSAGAIAVGGLITWFFGSLINKARVGYDQQTGQYYKAGGQHTFFFIPVEYWGILALAGGAALFVAALL